MTVRPKSLNHLLVAGCSMARRQAYILLDKVHAPIFFSKDGFCNFMWFLSPWCMCKCFNLLFDAVKTWGGGGTSRLTAQIDSRLVGGSPMISAAQTFCHQCKMAVPLSGIFWIYFSTVGTRHLSILSIYCCRASFWFSLSWYWTVHPLCLCLPCRYLIEEKHFCTTCTATHPFIQ